MSIPRCSKTSQTSTKTALPATAATTALCTTGRLPCAPPKRTGPRSSLPHSLQRSISLACSSAGTQDFSSPRTSLRTRALPLAPQPPHHSRPVLASPAPTVANRGSRGDMSPVISALTTIHPPNPHRLSCFTVRNKHEHAQHRYSQREPSSP